MTPKPCAWCSLTVVADEHGSWVHTDGIYACRNQRDDILSGRYAFPKTSRWPLITDADLPTSRRRHR